ncbi:MAG: hypothetical protein SOU50_00615 [Oscillospiraceae bacterium]|nr:hypothetical protein [Oscillospiraceae bacterium]
MLRIKRVKLCAALAAVMTLSGCSLFSSAEGLLAPPMLSEEQSRVYEALTDAVGSVNLIFPKNGENRSAYIFSDLDGDGSDEAAVFYRRPDGGESVIRLNILDIENGEWRSVYDTAGTGVSVDCALVRQIGGSGRTYIAAGYNLMTAGDKVLEIYSYENGVTERVYSDSYSSFMVTDLTSDGNYELININGNSENQSAYAAMMTEDENGALYEASKVRLSSACIGFESITEGRIAENTAAVFIDEINGNGSVSTEIIYSVDGNLRNPAEVEGSTVLADTKRQSGYSCADADGDGITEIPVTEVCPGYENETEKLLLTNWCVFDNYSIKRKYTGWYNKAQSWVMMFPGRWEGLITMKIDSASGAAVFCRYNENINSSPELMRILAVSAADSEAYYAEGWQLIEQIGDACYMVRLADDSGESLVLTLTEVRNNFYVIE